MQIRAIIIDDEVRARNGLKKMIENYCQDVEIVGLADSVDTGIQLIQEVNPDLLFLDIDMPDGDGFELIEKIDTLDFEIIFATAYDQFALKAIKYSALDYLVKPIDLDELTKAVEKAKTQVDKKVRTKQYDVLRANIKNNVFEKIVMPTLDGLVFIKLDEVISFSADGSYTYVNMNNNDKHFISKSLRQCEELLYNTEFMRVHNSHIINVAKVRKYVPGRGGYVIMEDESKIDISARRKDAFLEVIKNL